MHNSVSVYPFTFVFVDLETTGLHEVVKGKSGCESHAILEVGLHVTDPDLNIIDGDGLHLILQASETDLLNMTDWSRKQHQASGLLDKVKQSDIDLKLADRLIVEHMERYSAGPYDAKSMTGSVLAGNNIALDKAFINAKLPAFDRYLHFCLADFSTLNLFCREWAPHISDKVRKKYNHRALDDVKESISEARLYKRTIFDRCPYA